MIPRKNNLPKRKLKMGKIRKRKKRREFMINSRIFSKKNKPKIIINSNSTL